MQAIVRGAAERGNWRLALLGRFLLARPRLSFEDYAVAVMGHESGAIGAHHQASRFRAVVQPSAIDVLGVLLPAWKLKVVDEIAHRERTMLFRPRHAGSSRGRVFVVFDLLRTLRRGRRLRLIGESEDQDQHTEKRNMIIYLTSDIPLAMLILR